MDLDSAAVGITVFGFRFDVGSGDGWGRDHGEEVRHCGSNSQPFHLTLPGQGSKRSASLSRTTPRAVATRARKEGRGKRGRGEKGKGEKGKRERGDDRFT